MALDDFDNLLKWLAKNNISCFNFTGGEPTIHPRFNEFIDRADKQSFSINIFSNGLFPFKSLKNLNKINSFLINYNPENHYTQEEYELLHKNLSNLEEENVKIKMMCNITDTVDSCEYILEACKKYKAQEVLIDLIIPNALKSNAYINKNIIQKKKNLLLDFLEQLKNNNVKARISRPMPRCFFAKKELEKLKKFKMVYHTCGTGESIISINPDLTVHPCLSIFYKGPRIIDFDNLGAYRQFYRNSVNSLKWQKTLYPKCKSCRYFLRRQCQGACLCHKCKDFNLLSSDHHIIYSQYKKEEISEFNSAVEQSINKLNKIFGPIGKKIQIYLFDNKGDMWSYSGIHYYPEWVTGFTSSNLTYYQYGTKLHNRITHELCHMYIQHFSNSRVPTWLNEGFCEYVTFPDNTENLLHLMKTKTILPFEKLDFCGHMSLLKYDQDPLDKNICYHQAHNFVRYLVNNFGLDIVKKMITTKHDGFYKLFNELTKKDFFEIEKAWQKIINYTPIEKTMFNHPSEVVVEVTPKCNFDCTSCFNKASFAKNDRHQKGMSTEYIKQIIDSIVEFSIPRIRFSGGEPLLREDIFELMDYAKSKDLVIWLNTNATLVIKENISELEKYVENVLIPLNGYDEQSDFEWTQTKQSFEAKLKGIKILRASKIKIIRAGTVATPKNIENLEKIYQIVKENKLDFWELYRPIPLKKESTGFDIKTLHNKIIKLSSDFGKTIQIANSIPFCCYDIGKMDTICIGAYSDDGHSRIIVDPKGFAKPSYFIHKNIGDPRNVKECWNHDFMKKIRALELVPGDCKACKYLEKCKGGSRYTANLYSNDYKSNDPLMKLFNRVII